MRMRVVPDAGASLMFWLVAWMRDAGAASDVDVGASLKVWLLSDWQNRPAAGSPGNELPGYPSFGRFATPDGAGGGTFSVYISVFRGLLLEIDSWIGSFRIRARKRAWPVPEPSFRFKSGLWVVGPPIRAK